MPRRGFTLTELMVVMVILAVLTTMTVAVVNFSMAAERSRAAARQVQSFLAGARDRAIYEKHPVGVRFLVDDNIPGTASSMIYVEEATLTGTVKFVSDTTGTTTVEQVDGDTVWKRLREKGLLETGTLIRIPDNDDGFWHGVYGFPSDTEITFSPKFREPRLPTRNLTFRLRLHNIVRPNQEPSLLPRGIVIDLDRSKLPRFWKEGLLAAYTDRLDIVFSPNGTVTGQVAAGGLVHFYLAESADTERLNGLGIGSIPSDVPYGSDDELGDRLLVTVFARTGSVSSHPVDPTPSSGDARVAEDPYRYAETGQVAGE